MKTQTGPGSLLLLPHACGCSEVSISNGCGVTVVFCPWGLLTYRSAVFQRDLSVQFSGKPRLFWSQLYRVSPRLFPLPPLCMSLSTSSSSCLSSAHHCFYTHTTLKLSSYRGRDDFNIRNNFRRLCMPVPPALRQEDCHHFEARLVYIMSETLLNTQHNYNNNNNTFHFKHTFHSFPVYKLH